MKNMNPQPKNEQTTKEDQDRARELRAATRLLSDMDRLLWDAKTKKWRLPEDNEDNEDE